MRLYLAQINPTVGDLEGNLTELLNHLHKAREAGAQLFVAPELALTGYPPRDLLDRPGFVQDALNAMQQFANRVRGIKAIVGGVVSASGAPLQMGARISNGAVLIEEGVITACHRKILLPTYDVFDEARYFTPGSDPTVVTLEGVAVGITICEDIWNDKDYWRSPRYEQDPMDATLQAGAELLVNLSASPYEREKPQMRRGMLKAHAQKHNVPVIYCNQVGGNDSLLFDGNSSCVNPDGEIVLQGAAFATEGLVVELQNKRLLPINAPAPSNAGDWREETVQALTLGIRDYARKCGFKKVVIGMSGGIDSALTAALAVRALGPDNVVGITMPSRYSSEGAAGDAIESGKRLGFRVDTLPIEGMFAAYLEALAPAFAGREPDVAEENLQARIRGGLLMAYSNKFGALLLTTGNKSEMAVGYCTLYGDMCGGLAVISDVYKTDVYTLCEYLNATTTPAPIPESTLTKPPSAELRPDQKDEDSLPPYPQLDGILRGYIDAAHTPDELVAAGNERALVEEILRLVNRNEYKRRQAPPGLRVSHKAFGEGRRLPIAQRYTG